MPRHIKRALKEQIIKLYHAGATLGEIFVITGKSTKSISKWCGEAGIHKRPKHGVQTYESYFMWRIDVRLKQQRDEQNAKGKVHYTQRSTVVREVHYSTGANS